MLVWSYFEHCAHVWLFYSKDVIKQECRKDSQDVTWIAGLELLGEIR